MVRFKAEGEGPDAMYISLYPLSHPVRWELGLSSVYRTDPGSERPSHLSKVTQQQQQGQDVAWVRMNPETMLLTTAAHMSITSISRGYNCFLRTYCVPSPLTH